MLKGFIGSTPENVDFAQAISMHGASGSSP
jgi:hypothetical protein